MFSLQAELGWASIADALYLIAYDTSDSKKLSSGLHLCSSLAVRSGGRYCRYWCGYFAIGDLRVTVWRKGAYIVCWWTNRTHLEDVHLEVKLTVEARVVARVEVVFLAIVL